MEQIKSVDGLKKWAEKTFPPASVDGGPMYEAIGKAESTLGKNFFEQGNSIITEPGKPLQFLDGTGNSRTAPDELSEIIKVHNSYLPTAKPADKANDGRKEYTVSTTDGKTDKDAAKKDGHGEGGGLSDFLGKNGWGIAAGLLGLVVGSALGGGSMIMGLIVAALAFAAVSMMNPESSLRKLTSGDGKSKKTEPEKEASKQKEVEAPAAGADKTTEAAPETVATTRKNITAPIGEIKIKDVTYDVIMPGTVNADGKSAEFAGVKLKNRTTGEVVDSIDGQKLDDMLVFKTKEGVAKTATYPIVKLEKGEGVDVANRADIIKFTQKHVETLANNSPAAPVAEKTNPAAAQAVDLGPNMEARKLHTLNKTDSNSKEVFANIGIGTIRTADGQQREFTMYLRGTKNEQGSATFDRVVFQNDQKMALPNNNTMKLAQPVSFGIQSLPTQDGKMTDAIVGPKKEFNDIRSEVVTNMKDAVKKGVPAFTMNEPSQDDLKVKEIADKFKAGEFNNLAIELNNANLPGRAPNQDRTV